MSGDLERLLDSQDPEQRRRAAEGLRHAPNELVLRTCLRALGDADWRVRKEAVTALVARGAHPEVLRRLLSAFQPGDNVGLRNAVVDALAGHGDAAISEISRALPGLDVDGKKLCVDALGRSGSARALVVLEGLIADADPNVRAAAVEAVAAVGDTRAARAISLLTNALPDRDAIVRLAALQGLNRLSAALPWESVAGLLDDPVLYPEALVAAGRSGATEAAEPLVSAIGRAARIELVLAALVDLSRCNAEAVEAILRARPLLTAQGRDELLALLTRDAGTVAVGPALIVAGLLAVPGAERAIVEALVHDELRGDAEEAAIHFGSLLHAELLRGAEGESTELRAVCVEALGASATPGDAAAAQVVTDALHASEPQVVAAALAAVAMLGDEAAIERVARWVAPAVSPALSTLAEKALRELARRHPVEAQRLAADVDESSDAVVAAAIVIGAMPIAVRGSREGDVGFLSTLLTRGEPHVRRIALDALGEIGGALGVEPVTFALADEELEVQLAAVRALGKLAGKTGDARAIERLFDAAGGVQGTELAAAAIRGLGGIADSDVVARLVPLTRSADPELAVAAVDALGRRGEGARLDALVEALGHRDAEVVKAALTALATVAEPRATVHLGACLDHAAWDVRRLAADLLGRRGGPTVAGLLAARLANEREPLVRDALTRALEMVEIEAGARRTNPPPASVRR